eukprot:TRINITY_DN6112_c0_g1_i2.p1 TRINITY_DN6112_c0_g1~~TRINITY_DN6112_c0_g1_i2.p1  ORF type:complete len:256 (-),score=61.70 TRINITY_DN6112_c0_g1_i2:50-817(-)
MTVCQDRSLAIFLMSVVLGRGIATDQAHAELVSDLPADDECDGSGACAFHALQFRSQRSEGSTSDVDNNSTLRCKNALPNASNLLCASDDSGTLFRCESEGEDGVVKVKECGAGLCQEDKDSAYCVDEAPGGSSASSTTTSTEPETTTTTTAELPRQSKDFECENYSPGKQNFFCAGDDEGTIVSCMKKGAAGAVKFQKCGKGKCQESLESYGHNAWCLATATATSATAAVEDTDAATPEAAPEATDAANPEATD